MVDGFFIASFEIMVRPSRSGTPTPERLESLVVEAQGDGPHRTLAAAFSVMALEVVREGYGFPEGAVVTRAASPHERNVVDLQAASPSPDAPCVVEMFLCDAEASRKSGLRVVARGDDPFAALDAAYGRMLAALGESLPPASVTHIDMTTW